jgi:hypothetical protein
MQTRKQKMIFYTGLRARKNGKHTVKQFLKVARKVYSPATCQAMKRSYNKSKYGLVCPSKNNVNGWIQFMGAELDS